MFTSYNKLNIYITQIIDYITVCKSGCGRGGVISHGHGAYKKQHIYGWRQTPSPI